jgi:hypothetical protein
MPRDSASWWICAQGLTSILFQQSDPGNLEALTPVGMLEQALSLRLAMGAASCTHRGVGHRDGAQARIPAASCDAMRFVYF